MSDARPRRVPPLVYGVVGLAMVVLGALAVARLGASADRTSTRPELTVEISFPASVEAGAVETAHVTITNSGGAGVDALFVSFSLVGGGEAGITPPLIESLAGERSSVVAVRPKPEATGGGVRFGFGPLRAGESKTVDFDLRIPDLQGTAANSIQVYDGSDPNVAAGARLETEVG